MVHLPSLAAPWFLFLNVACCGGLGMEDASPTQGEYDHRHFIFSQQTIAIQRDLNQDLAANYSKQIVGEEKDDDDELPSCNDVLLHETTEGRCFHAKNCDGEYIMTTLLPLAFCGDPSSTPAYYLILFPLSIVVSTILLFRLLGSTAESYFSPALEMISSEFRIPPPLAGVTLLALGNGAPDVSAVVNAIKINKSEGIALSLGELTGGGMFVQSIVVGRIVFLGSSIAKDGKMSSTGEGMKCGPELIRDITAYAISAVYVFLICLQGTIFFRHVVGMLGLYAAYVSVVFAFEIRRYHSSSASGNNTNLYSNMEEVGRETLACEVTGGPDVDRLTQQGDEAARLVVQTDQPGVNQQKRQDPPGIKGQSARVLRLIQKRQLLEKRKRIVLNDYNQDQPQDTSQLEQHAGDQSWSYQLFIDSLHELHQHFYDALREDVWSIGQRSRSEYACIVLETPFTICRKLVTPIPCEAEYNRSLVAYSIALSPLWICFYVSTKVDEALGLSVLFVSCCVSFVIGYIVLRYAPRKGDGTAMPLRYSLPIALYGFAIAATWIDVISDQLVNLLEFIGVILRIPAPIMGMTVLAWGNSVGDYTTNGALAQRGLADMSMTACFAGPSFNLLVGLGFGFLTQKESLLNDGLPITLGPSVFIGFVFLISNCTLAIVVGIWNKGFIPKMHGYVFYAAYFAYFTMNAQNLAM